MKKLYFIFIYIIILTSLPSVLEAQVDPAFSRRGLNQEIYNPAYIIPENVIRADLTVRQQWAGFENAPNNQVLNLTNFVEAKRFGFGLSVVNLNQGIENYQNIKLKYAYQIWLKKDIIISMGVGAGIINHRLKNSELIFEDQGDPIRDANFDRLTPDFDLGFAIFARSWEAAFSLTHFVNSSKNATNYRVPRHQYAYLGYLFHINKDLSLKPMLAYRGSRNLARFDASVSGNYKDFLGADFGFTFNRSLFFSVSIAPTNWIKFVYAFDMNAGKLITYNANIHEIGVIMKLRKKSLMHKSPRFFD